MRFNEVCLPCKIFCKYTENNFICIKKEIKNIGEFIKFSILKIKVLKNSILYFLID